MDAEDQRELEIFWELLLRGRCGACEFHWLDIWYGEEAGHFELLQAISAGLKGIISNGEFPPKLSELAGDVSDEELSECILADAKDVREEIVNLCAADVIAEEKEHRPGIGGSRRRREAADAGIV